MKKNCPYCGRFTHEKLHGACITCLRSGKKLPTALKVLYDQYEAGHFIGKEKSSVRGIINAINTLLFDGEWYVMKWDPMSNLRKVVETAAERPYLTANMIEEIEGIMEEVNGEKESLA
jgi:hypothetical protein